MNYCFYHVMSFSNESLFINKSTKTNVQWVSNYVQYNKCSKYDKLISSIHKNEKDCPTECPKVYTLLFYVRIRRYIPWASDCLLVLLI